MPLNEEHHRFAGVHQTLLEAMAWHYLDVTDVGAKFLRSLELEPLGDFYASKNPAEMVATLCIERSKLLNEKAAQRMDRVRKSGKLLLYYPKDSLFDGAAELASGGFFTANNEPPWNTWLYYGEIDPGLPDEAEGYLLSWVPEEYVQIAQRGIAVNPEGCLEWVSESKRAFILELSHFGLEC
jgi:hypothetical protein